MYCQPNHGPQKASYAKIYATASKLPKPTFGYFFPKAEDQSESAETLAALDALGKAMIAQATDPERNAKLPPILTYFGQFIDHDITAGTDRDGEDEDIDGATITPRNRNDVVKTKQNMRSGRLDLDSLYGGVPNGEAVKGPDKKFLDKLEGLMRSGKWPGQMRISKFTPLDEGMDLPVDRAGDILRLGELMLGSSPAVTQAELDGLSPEMKEMFLNADGTANRQRAIIGDGRNDENLIVAQIQLAFLRLHNSFVIHCPDGSLGEGEVFEWARARTRWVYQWLVVNVYLRLICDSDTLDAILANGTPLYDAVRAAAVSKDDQLPLPVEFSTAAFRFGHSMVRASYDWNQFFGRPGDLSNILPSAPFSLMFAFTGGGNLAGRGDRLPSNWGADWPRMLEGQKIFPDRGSRKIDTQLAMPLDHLPLSREQMRKTQSVLQRLAVRNLRRGHLLNLPSAQHCVAQVQKIDPSVTLLTDAEMGGGAIADILAEGGMFENTPLWYYVLREAEVRADGETLGKLGTHLVAQTLIGLIAADKSSYLNQGGSDGGVWHPKDIAQGSIPEISSLEAMLTFVGLLR